MRDAALSFIRDNPGSTAVDMLCAGVDPCKEGTIVLIPVLLALEGEGRIRRAPDPYWADHVAAYPRAHPQPLTSILVDQAARWELAEAFAQVDGRSEEICP